ncbi:endonuclease dU [Halalkalicoccus jeotgali]|uniref:UPF0215 protein HacjB3_03650 n=1 Tax=Halalkalicoccus jeotgali (strain DSM 18796 / CECT 7217 / JCM 14584 / KCTC 4019 / B3) TaxID=795797 RepID=D8J808_HALJB|nr:DUF99 family protein [Halalkalicoccus jeotgali]ADJ14121.1 hypothetical protein HacjB3_03650 [Halalkalicoccus jeotgali B3]ELY34697.1 hypothetical protein C497_15643 [Halalkalicoccus jeotgali B3]
MKSGARVLGVAESFRGERSPGEPSTLAGALVRADRVVDGLAFGSLTIGGEDATDAVVALFLELDRADVQYVLLSGIAPAWYNLLDLPALADALDRPVCAVSFERSPGLEGPLREAFSGAELDRHLAVYERQPARERIEIGEGEFFWRGVGLDAAEARELLFATATDGGRPEPLRVARLAARAADRFREDL